MQYNNAVLQRGKDAECQRDMRSSAPSLPSVSGVDSKLGYNTSRD